MTNSEMWFCNSVRCSSWDEKSNKELLFIYFQW